ncbi:hypothetical protein [Plebeiibacterium marinum]|uniref:Uncharacterized protein n=1 Tax=Plebeiibacterium marinum TaxID=2992111 RepID=A0AAE3MBC0_9BACT|nr:hypothetical protein [Plebeiobacterium marinum]MCW3804656.1 hypothetical protein [Plebeiobacterium marinum]
MKTSKIIFSSYFSLFGIVLISLMICGFAFNSKQLAGRFSKNNIEEEKINLNSFKHIKLESECNVTIIKDSFNFISYSFFKDSIKMNPEFNFSADTLILKSTKSNLHNNINLHVAQDISINGNSCSIELRQFAQNKLNADLKNSRLTLSKNSSIENFMLTLENSSRFTYWDGKIKNLYLNMDNSRFDNGYRLNLDKLNAKIYNNSNAYLPPALICDIKRDKSSKVKIN